MADFDFTWRDGERLIRFGAGCADEAVDLFGGPGYTLLTSPSCEQMRPDLVAAAGELHRVPAGWVDEVSAELLPAVGGDRLVAFGGGRVIDVAKAIAAARGGDPSTRAMAVPTTLSGAEMTWVHRLPRGIVEARNRRPTVVLNDPRLSASQALPGLAASSLNAFAHAAEGPCTLGSNPVATLVGDQALELLVSGWADGAPKREMLALGALLAGYVIDSTWYGLHHVVSQTVVRLAGVEHATANAVLLPHTLPMLAARFPDRFDSIERSLGKSLVEAAAGIAAGAGLDARLDIDAAQAAECAAATVEREELDLTPPRPSEQQLRELYEQAASAGAFRPAGEAGTSH